MIDCGRRISPLDQSQVIDDSASCSKLLAAACFLLCLDGGKRCAQPPPTLFLVQGNTALLCYFGTMGRLSGVECLPSECLFYMRLHHRGDTIRALRPPPKVNLRIIKESRSSNGGWRIPINRIVCLIALTRIWSR